VRVDLRTAEVLKEGANIELSAREFQLLRYFIAHPGRVISRDELLEKVWHYDSSIFTRTVDVHVAQLRKKLDSNPQRPVNFITVRGMGYRFIPG
jgi:DNA-binding response OmpR family regulator